MKFGGCYNKVMELYSTRLDLWYGEYAMDFDYNEDEYEYEDKGDTALLVRKNRRGPKNDCDFVVVFAAHANGTTEWITIPK